MALSCIVVELFDDE